MQRTAVGFGLSVMYFVDDYEAGCGRTRQLIDRISIGIFGGKTLARVLVLGGDGFCGWPTTLHLSALGHRVSILDNLSRRKIESELNAESLTPIASIDDRIDTWRSMTRNEIDFRDIDISSDPELLLSILKETKPDAVVHFAEQRAAPYSMKSAWHKRFTVNNNVNATHNLLAAIVESGLDIHVVHLGTMGVYGYGALSDTIPEGYLPVTMPNSKSPDQKREILHPTDPGSVYHMTKTLDQLLFAYYAKNDGLRVTDLHQGIVWGTQTKETDLADALINRFDYDGDFGTVLNRFLMQSAVGYPLSVHGTGGQTRAFIHIQDTVRCIELALDNPPGSGERVKILNQLTETFRVRDLADLVAARTGAEVQFLDNPRNEKAENELSVENQQLMGLGLQPIKLDGQLLQREIDLARRFASRCDTSKIPCTSYWRPQ